MYTVGYSSGGFATVRIPENREREHKTTCYTKLSKVVATPMVHAVHGCENSTRVCHSIRMCEA